MRVLQEMRPKKNGMDARAPARCSNRTQLIEQSAHKLARAHMSTFLTQTRVRAFHVSGDGASFDLVGYLPAFVWYPTEYTRTRSTKHMNDMFMFTCERGGGVVFWDGGHTVESGDAIILKSHQIKYDIELPFRTEKTQTSPGVLSFARIGRWHVRSNIQ